MNVKIGKINRKMEKKYTNINTFTNLWTLCGRTLNQVTELLLKKKKSTPKIARSIAAPEIST